ncbi:MAG: hypothetical protein NTY33_00135 [Candidatus Moranbacteria bacterium]|nr:hypothetical protein [Candidatus Moranbacteria bacterium]
MVASRIDKIIVLKPIRHGDEDGNWGIILRGEYPVMMQYMMERGMNIAYYFIGIGGKFTGVCLPASLVDRFVRIRTIEVVWSS